jgi:hypothetical protein
VGHGIDATRPVVEDQKVDDVFEILELDLMDAARKDRKPICVIRDPADRVAN